MVRHHFKTIFNIQNISIYGDDIQWETIIIASIDKVSWIFADDKERRQWRRIDSDHFILNKKRGPNFPRGDPSDPWKITRTSWNRRS